MRVVEVPEYGGNDVLRVTERERPSPGPGELVIETRESTGKVLLVP